MTKSELINLIKIGEDSMAKIHSNHGNGSGFFCSINDPNINFKHALFTNNHVLDEESIKIGEKISLEYKSELKYFTLDEKRKVYTNKELDYTCIEIKDEDNVKDFFLIDEKILNGNCNYKNEDIIILQFPKGGEISFSEGKILRMNETQIFYTSSTEPGSSGSPLIIRKNILKYYIIGIHVGAIENKKCNFGSSFKPILDDIKNKSKKCTSESSLKPILDDKKNKNTDTKQSKGKENNDLGSPSESLKKNLDDYEFVELSYFTHIFFRKEGNDFERPKISKTFKLCYYDNTGFPSLFEYYLSQKFDFRFWIDIIIRLKDFYYKGALENGGLNGFRKPVMFSPLTIIFFKADEDINDLSDMIKIIREKKRYDFEIEVFLVWNAYDITEGKTISEQEKKQFLEKNKIKYSLTVLSKEDCEYFFKELLYVLLTDDKVNENFEKMKQKKKNK
jgi:hypothetical protein